MPEYLDDMIGKLNKDKPVSVTVDLRLNLLAKDSVNRVVTEEGDYCTLAITMVAPPPPYYEPDPKLKHYLIDFLSRCLALEGFIKECPSQKDHILSGRASL